MTDDYTMQASFKTPFGTLVNLRASSPEELDAVLAAYAERVQKVYEVEQAIAAVGNVAPLQGAPGALPNQADSNRQGGNVVPFPQQGQPNAHPKGKTCDKCAAAGQPGVPYRYGDSGTKKDGVTPWTRWDCVSGIRDHVAWG